MDDIKPKIGGSDIRHNISKYIKLNCDLRKKYIKNIFLNALIIPNICEIFRNFLKQKNSLYSSSKELAEKFNLNSYF